MAAAGGPKPRAKQSPEALKAKRAASWAIYYEQHKERLLARKREYNANDRESYLATQRAWREKNTARRTALQAKRKARQLQAVPGWFDELDEFVWLEASDLCIIRRDATGIEWNADHMIPLAAKKACGLHVASNCQVIPAYLNNWKHNKMVLTRPDEWLAKLAK